MGMDPNSGRYVEMGATLPTGAERERAAAELGIAVDDLLVFQGTPETAELLSRRVALGRLEEERRRARRKQQRESRKRNRA